MKRIAIFVHFDIHDKVDDYVVFYLKSLKKAVDDIVFVSASKLDEKELLKVKPYAIHSIVRENIGYDFASYRDGFAYLKQQNILKNYDEVVFCNDSAYGGFHSFKNMFKAMEERKCDFWGLTDTYMHDYHLQSYFLVFRKSVFLSEVFDNFIKSVTVQKTKDDVIQKYEVGLSSMLFKNGFKSSSFIDVHSFYKKYFIFPGLGKVAGLLRRFIVACNMRRNNIASFRRHSVNIKHIVIFSYPLYCLRQKSPLIKKSLFTENLSDEMVKVLQEVDKNTTYDVNIIKRYMERIFSNTDKIDWFLPATQNHASTIFLKSKQLTTPLKGDKKWKA